MCISLGVTLRPLDTLTIDIDYDHRSGYGGESEWRHPRCEL